MKVPLLILFLSPFIVFAQSLAGIWTGYLKTTDNTLPFELAISGEGKEEFSGYSHTVFTFNGVDNIGVKTISLKNKKGNVSLEDGELVYSNYTQPPKRVKLFGKMFLRTSDSLLVLTGSFFTRTIDFREESRNSFVGTIYLRKQKGFPQTKLIAKLAEMELLHTLSFAPEQFKKKEEPIVAATVITPPVSATPKEIVNNTAEKEKPAPKPKKQKDIVKKEDKKEIKVPEKKVIASIEKPVKAAAAEIVNRKTEIIRNVSFSSDSLVLSLYDNGTVDGDTVSVVLNGVVIIAKKGLSENAIKTTIHITPELGDSLQLVMYAENLGSIPPNTGVLIVQDGRTRNEIRFAGDMQKSSAIILKRKKGPT
jgi:hypothetical protein